MGLREIFLTFLKIGLYSFGGPGTHMRSIESELIKNKKALSEDLFDDLKKGSFHLPGLISTGIVMKTGYKIKGVIGFILAAIGYVLPGALILSLAGLYYKELGTLPMIAPFLYGLKPAVLAILLFTVIKLGFKFLTNISYLANFLLVVIAYFIGFDIIWIMILAMMANVFFDYSVQKANKQAKIPALLPQAVSTVTVSFSTATVLATFVKIGFLLAGSGFVLVAFAKVFLVDNGLLTVQALLDGTAFSLFVPGPITGLAAFLGFQLDAWRGSFIAVSGLLLAASFYAIIGLVFEKLILQWRLIGILTKSWNVAALGFLFACTLQISSTILIDYKLWIIGCFSLIILLKWPKLHKVWILIIAANLGYILHHYLA